MNTKEAINFLMVYREYFLQKGKINEIIKLLQRGGKYEKVVNEIDERLILGKPIPYHDGLDIKDLSTLDFVKLIIKDIKQKYFPEPVKKTITIEIETNNKEVLYKRISGLKSWLTFCNNNKQNEKYEYRIVKECD